MMPCKNVCGRPEYQRPGERRRSGGMHYADGWKRCIPCRTMLRHDGLWCPCCGKRLRTRPRQARAKRRWLESTAVAAAEP